MPTGELILMTGSTRLRAHVALGSADVRQLGGEIGGGVRGRGEPRLRRRDWIRGER